MIPPEAAHLQKLADNDLLILLGRELSADVLAALPVDADTAKQTARGWFHDRGEAIRKIVCGARIAKMAADAEVAEVATALAALIEGFTSGTAATAVAILIVRKGVSKYCAGEWVDL